ncbi:amidase [Agaricicola taiwanensis]|uniref:Amidase n=1 Tax=Agaricicola taiwanensis TaxID=591372 RepID=A0A8J2VJA3_9RHOB|nr:amidase [Agaricicola taiwanensis]GGE28323.1 amidase [Agaricicola taiwanensis]
MEKQTLTRLSDDLRAGRTSAAALVEACLDRIADPAGQGGVTFLSVDGEGARKAAAAMDALRAAGAAPSPFAGIPISVKDLFDLAGQTTKAGSRALADAPPARADAPVIARLRAAGFVVVGRTNMTEFAFSGLGLNPHYGTPLSPASRHEGRIAGGSSSGAAVSLAEAMAHGAIGTDTGGSCRIPAAFCGLVGYKPTVGTVSGDGIIPLSRTLDSAGPIGRSVECTRILFDIMAGDVPAKGAAGIRQRDVANLTIAVPQTLVLDDMDEHVGRLFERSLSRLSKAGARVVEIKLAEFGEIPELNAKGGYPASEGYAWHRALLQSKKDLYDPRVALRLMRGEKQSAADYIDLEQARADFVRRVTERMSAYHALAFPTVPVVAPRLEVLETDDDAFTRVNLLVLRNSTAINMADGCAISIPMEEGDETPAGLTLAAAGGDDRRLLATAMAVEAALA